MQALRNASFLARLVLAWFALTLGIAVASPVVNPQGMQLLCTGGGAMKLLVQGQESGGQPAGAPTLDCPLCIALDAPLPPAIAFAVQGAWAGPAPASVLSGPAIRFAAVPPPARGPPRLLLS